MAAPTPAGRAPSTRAARRQAARREGKLATGGRAGAASHRRRPTRLATGLVAVIAVGILAAGAAFAAGAFGGGTGASPVPSGTVVFAESDHAHVTGTVSYDRTPPAGGAHSAVWLNCGVYPDPVPDENAVHSLEHGAVWITYRPDLATDEVAQLRQFAESHRVGTQGYIILSPYPGIPSPIVASAWGAQLAVPSPGDPDLAAFVQHYAGGAQGGEPGGECTGGVGSPVG